MAPKGKDGGEGANGWRSTFVLDYTKPSIIAAAMLATHEAVAVVHHPKVETFQYHGEVQARQ